MTVLVTVEAIALACNALVMRTRAIATTGGIVTILVNMSISIALKTLSWAAFIQLYINPSMGHNNIVRKEASRES